MTASERHDKATEAAMAALQALAKMDFAAARLAFFKGYMVCGVDSHPEPPPKHWQEKGEGDDQ